MVVVEGGLVTGALRQVVVHDLVASDTHVPNDLRQY